MTIYIPVIFLCVGEVCNFMQGQVLHKTEASCKAAVDMQKAYMTVISNEANQGKITLIEGTCINVELPRNNV
jgi:hypothetical protein